jgi:hypothetical protein
LGKIVIWLDESAATFATWLDHQAELDKLRERKEIAIKQAAEANVLAKLQAKARSSRVWNCTFLLLLGATACYFEILFE